MDKWEELLKQELTSEKVDLIVFVKRACNGLPIEPRKVIDNMLSVNDEQEIIKGKISKELIRLHIETWLKDGSLHISGK